MRILGHCRTPLSRFVVDLLWTWCEFVELLRVCCGLVDVSYFQHKCCGFVLGDFSSICWWTCFGFVVDTEKGKDSPYSVTERRVPELIPLLGSQPAGDVSYKPGGRLPLLSARPAVTPATIKRAATNFAAWWTEAQWVWTVTETVTRQLRDCDLNPGPSAPESSTLTTRLPSNPL